MSDGILVPSPQFCPPVVDWAQPLGLCSSWCGSMHRGRCGRTSALLWTSFVHWPSAHHSPSFWPPWLHLDFLLVFSHVILTETPFWLSSLLQDPSLSFFFFCSYVGQRLHTSLLTSVAPSTPSLEVCLHASYSCGTKSVSGVICKEDNGSKHFHLASS